MDEISFDYETTVYQWLGDGGMPYLEVQSTFGVPFRVRYQGETEEDTSSTEGINTVLQRKSRFTLTLQNLENQYNYREWM